MYTSRRNKIDPPKSHTKGDQSHCRLLISYLAKMGRTENQWETNRWIHDTSKWRLSPCHGGRDFLINHSSLQGKYPFSQGNPPYQLWFSAPNFNQECTMPSNSLPIMHVVTLYILFNGLWPNRVFQIYHPFQHVVRLPTIPLNFSGNRSLSLIGMEAP